MRGRRPAIPFIKPFAAGNAQAYMAQAMQAGSLAGRGPFTERCEDWLRRRIGAGAALLTHSGSGALELAALLIDLAPGDEVVMASFTFPSMANAVVLRGAVPVFVDIRPDTLNLDERSIEAAVGPRTRAVLPMHYAGVGCAMDDIGAIARRHDLRIIEDAAHAILATYKGRRLGTLGDLAAFSFHDTKNLQCGEGGALLVNDPALVERAEILLEKGTNRVAFHRGTVDRYRWVDLGSSFVASELAAALLYAQFEAADTITQARSEAWQRYHAALAPLEGAGRLTRPSVPDECAHNAHIYYVLLPDPARRDAVIAAMRAAGISTPFHYVPLHSAPAGRRFGRCVGDLPVTEDVAARLIRLPLWPGVEPLVEQVVEQLAASL